MDNYLKYIEYDNCEVYDENNDGKISWKCPATGKWKVICVGGGSSAYVTTNSDYDITGAGGDTTFGTICFANGGIVNKKYGTQCYNSNGFFPYENKYPEFSDSYDSIQSGTMGGYGGSVIVRQKNGYVRADSDMIMSASGMDEMAYANAYVNNAIRLGTYSYTYTNGNSGGSGYNWDTHMYISNGVAGEVKINITDLTSGTNVPIKIGSGGTVKCTENIAKSIISTAKNEIIRNYTDRNYTFELNGDVSTAAKLSAKINERAFVGRPGVVILQYLGA